MAVIMDTRREYPRRSSIPKVFGQVVERNGGSMALSFGGAWLTYAELDARAAELAARLEGCGVRPGAQGAGRGDCRGVYQE